MKLFALLLLLPTLCFAQNTNFFMQCFTKAQTRGLPKNGLLFVVTADDQTLTAVDASGIKKQFKVSTSKTGLGSEAGSEKTPLGWHVVDERIGGDQPPGRVFVKRKPTAMLLKYDEWRNPNSGDYVLTRILWLRGLDRGLNTGDPSISSHARGIYLHGTNQEQLLGQPASHGCIRLSNRDILELFDWTENRRTYCEILKMAALE